MTSMGLGRARLVDGQHAAEEVASIAARVLPGQRTSHTANAVSYGFIDWSEVSLQYWGPYGKGSACSTTGFPGEFIL